MAPGSEAASITAAVTILKVDTPHGQANAHVHPADEPRAALVLGHGAAGGVTSRDLVAVTDVARSQGVSVALLEQPGLPPAAVRRTVVQVPGNHSLRTDLEAVAAAVRAWLPRVMSQATQTAKPR